MNTILASDFEYGRRCIGEIKTLVEMHSTAWERRGKIRGKRQRVQRRDKKEWKEETRKKKENT